jgi:maltokinase
MSTRSSTGADGAPGPEPARGQAPGAASEETEPASGPGTASASFPIGDVLARARGALATWMPTQRWYPAKGSGTPDVAVRGWTLLADADDAAVIDTVLRLRGDALADTHVQVPLVLRRSPGSDPDGGEREGGAGPAGGMDPANGMDPAAGAGIAVLPAGSGDVLVEDACRTDVGRRALFDFLTRGERSAGDAMALLPSPVPGRTGAPVVASRLLSGEQSNSSMIFTLEDADPVILKLFRVLAAGENPDVVLQGALDRAGCRRVAPMIGSVRLRLEGGGEELAADALLAQGFLPDVEDAWRVALQQAAGGIDFREGARDLGAATAEVHRLLARELPSAPASADERARVVDQMRARLDEVTAQVPQVLPHRPALGALIDAAADVPWPPLQRIHGDYHLGQVLADPARGWVLLDFEGEPMRPLAERSLPDSPVRDVAGMLRSLDYAGGAVRLEHGVDASAWVADASQAFLDGYLDAMGISREDPSFLVLLRAFEADKAVYEVLYEARNRPDWLPIPLGALERITGR